MPIHSRRSYDDQRLASIKQVNSLMGIVPGLITRLHPGLAEFVCNTVTKFIDTPGLYQFSVALLWARNDLQALEYVCRNAIHKYPGRPYFRQMYSELAERSSEVERALSILGPEQPEKESVFMLLLRIRLHRRRNQLEEALRLAKIVCRRFPDAAKPRLVLGQVLAMSGRRDEAAKCFSEGMTRFPQTLKFPELLSGMAKRAGDEATSIQLDMTCLDVSPDNRRALESLAHSLETTAVRPPEALAYFDTYEANAKLKPAEFRVLRRIATVTGKEIDPVALRRVAYATGPISSDPLDRLLALAALEDFEEAAKSLAALIAEGHWDQRFTAYLKAHGEQLQSVPIPPHLPTLDFIAAKLRMIAHNHVKREFAQYLSGTIVNRVLKSTYPEELRPRISFICPIHRKRDVPNLLLQIQRQHWQPTEVVFCINSPEIDEADLALNPGSQYTCRIIRCDPGNTVGYYLNRCVKEATGDLIMRIDADDLYAPGYTGYMVRFIREVGSDIVSMDLSTVYLDDVEQTYLKKPLMLPDVAASGDVDEYTLGSGSSLCARREVFDKVNFDQSLNSGEDTRFYRMAASVGLTIRVAPNFFHTNVRHADKMLHTWRLDDFDIISERSVFLGDGPITPEPGSLPHGPGSGDPFELLFSDSRLRWMQELDIDGVLRSAVHRINLLVGKDTPVADCDSSVLQVARVGAPTGNGDSRVLVFIPEDPDLEESVARDASAISLTHDLMPELIVGKYSAIKSPTVLESRRRLQPELGFSQTTCRYAILCNPRAGSEYLCGLLNSMGMGNPRELLREPMANVLSKSSNPSAYLLNIFARQAGEGVFGTKIVSQFLFDQPEQDWVFDIMNWMVDNSFHIVRLNRPLEHAAISAYIAEKHGIWHYRERPGGHLAYIKGDKQKALPPYDFHGISSEMEKFLGWTTKLDEVIREIVPQERLREVNYDDLCAAPQGTAEEIADFIGFRPLPKSLAIGITRPTSNKFSGLKEYRQRFVKDWLAAQQHQE